MSIKRQPRPDAQIEEFLRKQGYTGIGVPRDEMVGKPQHDSALKAYNRHEYEGGIIRAQQFSDFFRYTKKEEK